MLQSASTVNGDNLIEIGLSHLLASVEARERATVPETRLKEALAELAEALPGCELTLLSTCSRLELYAAAPEPEEALRRARAWLAQRGGGSLGASLVERRGLDVVLHLFRVAAGLESWIAGESEVLGQVRRAYEAARAVSRTGPALNRVFQSAVAAGKLARSRTGIQNGIHSIGGAAALLARSIFGAERDGAVVVFGAGEAAEATARHLAAKSFKKVFVANRTRARAEELAARVGGTGVSIEDGLALLDSAEIAVFSTSCESALLRADWLRRLLPLRKRPLFLIDLGLPRNVEPACGALPEVFLYDLDDLKDVVARSLEAKAQEKRKADALVAQAAADCAKELEKGAARRAPQEAAA